MTAPAGALLAQILEHALHVGVGDFRGMADDFQLAHVELAEVRRQFHRGDVLQFALGGILARHHLRRADDVQFVLAHRLAQSLAQQAIEDLGADLAAVALLDHLGRHLARAEALDPHRVRDLAQAVADLRLDVAGRQAEDDATLEVADGFDRDLHDAMTPGRVRGNPELCGWMR